MIRLALVVLAACIVVPAHALYCDHGLAIQCFSNLDNSCSNIAAQTPTLGGLCGGVRQAYFDFYYCMKFAGCYQILLSQCDELVAVTNYNFNQLFDALANAGPSASINPNNCTMAANCNELFGAPIGADGAFVINAAHPVALSHHVALALALALFRVAWVL